MDELTGERYLRDNPLPDEIANMSLTETFCKYCGISYLMFHEFEMLKNKISFYEAKLKKTGNADICTNLDKELEEFYTFLKNKEVKEEERSRDSENVYRKFCGLNNNLQNCLSCLIRLRKQVKLFSLKLYHKEKLQNKICNEILLSTNKIARLKSQVFTLEEKMNKVHINVSSKVELLLRTTVESTKFLKDAERRCENLNILRENLMGNHLVSEQRIKSLEDQTKKISDENLRAVEELTRERNNALENSRSLNALSTLKEAENNTLQVEVGELRAMLRMKEGENARLEIYSKSMEDSCRQSLTEFTEEFEDKLAKVESDHVTEVHQLNLSVEFLTTKLDEQAEQLKFYQTRDKSVIKLEEHFDVVNCMKNRENLLNAEILGLNDKLKNCEDIIRKECEERQKLIKLVQRLKDPSTNYSETHSN